MNHGTQARVWRDGKGRVLKDLRGGDMGRVRKEYKLQARLALETQQTPRVFEMINRQFILMEDLGESEPITDLAVALAAAADLIRALKRAKIRHNDLLPANVLIRQNVPYAVDFGWAQWEAEDPLPDHPSDDKALISTLHHLLLDPYAKRRWSWKDVRG